MYQRNNEARSCNHCCRGGAESITYSECTFVALGIQHATSMRHIVWGLSGSTSFFHIISQTARSSQNIIEYRTCILIFSTNFVWNISHSKGNWARYNKNVCRSSCKVPVILSHFNDTWIFLTDLREIVKCQISLKSVPLEPSCSVRTDGQTDTHDEDNSRFSQFLRTRLKMIFFLATWIKTTFYFSTIRINSLWSIVPIFGWENLL